MDPNACLEELRQLAAETNWERDKPELHAMDKETPRARAERMAELVESLDGWLSKGGFLPTAWARR